MNRVSYDLPVKPYPVTFRVMLRDLRVYWFSTQYREGDEAGWLLDIRDADRLPLIMGTALVTGLNLVYQQSSFELGFDLVLLCQEGRTTPTFESLGNGDRLLIVLDE